MAWRSMTLDNPPRVVLDLDGQWKFPPNPGIPKNDLVTNVRIGNSSGNRTRVVIDLREKPKSARVIGARDGDGFDVRVDK
ncbi:MAG: AMIN domain-containing protein [Desulfovibrio sp.]